MIFANLYIAGVLLFVLGAIIGSFLNVVVLRHEKGEKLTGRSYCPHCKRQLRWYELIPVISYLLQRGRCRGCSARISIQYPLVELITGLLFVLIAYVVMSSGMTTLATSTLPLAPLMQLLLHFAVWSILIVITVYDFRTKLIPDKFSYSFSALALLSLFVSSLATGTLPLTTLVAGPLLFLPFYLLWKVSNGRWIGLGDGKLALGIGWLLGPLGGLSAVLFAFWIGAIVSLLIIAVQHLIVRFTFLNFKPAKTTDEEQNIQEQESHTASLHHSSTRLTLKSEIPFGPFLILGIAIVFFTGATIFTLFG